MFFFCLEKQLSTRSVTEWVESLLGSLPFLPQKNIFTDVCYRMGVEGLDVFLFCGQPLFQDL